MTDTRLDRISCYGTNAERLAFTPDPPAGVLVVFYEEDTGDMFLWDTDAGPAAWIAFPGGGGGIGGSTGATDNRILRADGVGGATVQNSALALADDGTISFPDGIRQTFNPDGTNAGVNVGSQAGDPSAPSNGDLWYDSTAERLKGRINGVTAPLGTMVLLDEQSPSGTGVVTFSSIPATFRHLRVTAVIRGTQAATSITVAITLNNDTTSGNYERQNFQGSNASATAAATTAAQTSLVSLSQIGRAHV